MKKKILVVDDERDVRRMTGMRLAAAGYTVIEAETGQDAIIIAQNQHPDLVMLDIMMPDMDGSKVAAALKENPSTKDIPIIYLTCLVSKDAQETGNVIGGSFFLAKPYEPEEMIRVVKKHIG